MPAEVTVGESETLPGSRLASGESALARPRSSTLILPSGVRLMFAVKIASSEAPLAELTDTFRASFAAAVA